ncbi:isochorismate synthase [Streptomyces sp. NPDC007117]|uniref:isochorismate synthase n=1 Tax=Streptomyces sp. NPDC007117 TaxID=3154314 RepID=UPI0033E7D72F
MQWTPSAHTAETADPLKDYRSDDFFFASAGHHLLARGAIARLRRPVTSDLPSQVHAVLGAAQEGGHAHPVAVGALPFHPGRLSNLRIPHTVRRHAPARSFTLLPLASPPACSPPRILHVPTPAEYATGVRNAIDAIRTGRADKIVLARALDLETDTTVNPADVLARLLHRDPRSFGFAVPVSTTGGDPGPRTLVGASPELLISRHGLNVTSRPLAGSAPRGATAEEDRSHANRLLASAKDRSEHAVVVEDVAAALAPYCRTLNVPVQPHLVKTAAMWHLATHVTGELADPSTNSLDLALALHPTPAVCGSPRAAALRAIAAAEPFDRGLYSGMAGWCDANGDGEWAVTIRCAEISPARVRLYAGAGIVAESDPPSELAETTAKFQTMLHALGLADIT